MEQPILGGHGHCRKWTSLLCTVGLCNSLVVAEEKSACLILKLLHRFNFHEVPLALATQVKLPTRRRVASTAQPGWFLSALAVSCGSAITAFYSKETHSLILIKLTPLPVLGNLSLPLIETLCTSQRPFSLCSHPRLQRGHQHHMSTAKWISLFRFLLQALCTDSSSCSLLAASQQGGSAGHDSELSQKSRAQCLIQCENHHQLGPGLDRQCDFFVM